MRLPGSAAFVTGAAQGLGKAFSESLLQRGTRVCMSDVQVKKGKEIESEFKSKYGKDSVLFLECDVKSDESFSNAFKKATSVFGSIDLLVNNAGIGDESKLKDMIGINLIGLITGTNLAIEHMRKDKGGKGGTIINVASTAGLTPMYFGPIYAASKYGAVGFTKSWASNPHNSSMGLQFGCLCPAFTATAIMDFPEGSIDHPEEALKIVEMIGVNKIEAVADGFLQLVEKENCNGDVVTITVKEGVRFLKTAKKQNSRL